MRAQLLGRGPPVRLLTSSWPRPTHPPRSSKRMKGARCEPSLLAAAHPSDPGARKEGNTKRGSPASWPRTTHPTQEPRKETQCEPSFFAAAHPSDPGPTRKHEGNPTEAQLLGRGPAQCEPSFLAAAHPSTQEPRKEI